jgi:L-seryl-tRNA(Ser) seleniumtransferase
MLPEVKRAMEDASLHFVILDELMESVGHRLASLTQAEWGIVTSGCAAALALATMACVTEGDPKKIARLPDSAGMKNEVIIPSHSRMEFEPAIRMAGVALIGVDTAGELQAAFNERTAMVVVMSSPSSESGPLSTEAICLAARSRGVPVLVDAAAEMLTIPNVHLNRGAAMVAFSGGKILRGPQSSGLLLGRKDLVQAAWRNSSPHEALGRPLKCGKEEIIGMLTAVEVWLARDHRAEWDQWQSWLDHIAAEVTRIEGVATEILLPEDLSNHSPRLKIRWQTNGLSGLDLERDLLNGNPRIVLSEASPDSITIMPYMMSAGEERIVADCVTQRLKQAFAEIPRMALAPHLAR